MGDSSSSVKSSKMPAARKSFVFKALFPLVVGIAIALVSHPSGLTSNAWFFFSLFSAVVVGLILEPIPAAATLLTGISPVLIMVFMVAVFFITHYMFASTTAHTTAMLPVFLSAGAAVPGMNVSILALLLAYSLGIMGIITPYATGPAPVYFGSGYIARQDFWKLGLVFGVIFLAVFLLVTTPFLFIIRL